MGFLLSALGIIAVGVGVNRIRKSNAENERRKQTRCYFNEGISESEFSNIVDSVGKGIKRLKSLHNEGPIVYGNVRSQSGLSDWTFTVDFNDYGHITGKYWLTTDNDDSVIPSLIANRIQECLKV